MDSIVPIAAPTGIDLEAIRERHENMRVLIRMRDRLAYHKNNVLRAHQDRGDLLDELSQSRALAASQAEQIAGMAKALEPFAKEATRSTREDADMADSVQWLSFSDITYGDLRTAKAAYDATERKPTDG